MKKGPKFKRKPSNRQKFLKSRGLKKTPKRKEVAHRKPLWKGGTDSPRNMMLKKKSTHKKETKRETKQRARIKSRRKK